MKIKETLETATNENSEFGETLRKELEEVKVQKLAELALMAKKKKVKVNADLLVVPRHTSPMICRIYARKLKEKMFENKGFILDGFPKAFPDATGLFLENGKENRFMPNKVILIEAEEEALNLRASEIPEEERKGTHYEKDGMARRISEYKQRHDKSQGYPPLIEFFTQRGVEVLKIAAETEHETNYKLIQEYIEKVC